MAKFKPGDHVRYIGELTPHLKGKVMIVKKVNVTSVDVNVGMGMSTSVFPINIELVVDKHDFAALAAEHNVIALRLAEIRKTFVDEGFTLYGANGQKQSYNLAPQVPYTWRKIFTPDPVTEEY